VSGKRVKVFLVDGTPGGLTTAEITNWTGKIVSAPRSNLGELLTRDEAARTGAYLLIGDDPEAVDGLRCYIGEADVIGARLKEHAGARGKDFWSRAVLIASKDDNLTKAHGRYLEARLIAMARAAGRSTVENGTSPEPPNKQIRTSVSPHPNEAVARAYAERRTHRPRGTRGSRQIRMLQLGTRSGLD